MFTKKNNKSLLSACLTHTLDLTNQMQMLCNELEPKTKKILDLASDSSSNFKTTIKITVNEYLELYVLGV